MSSSKAPPLTAEQIAFEECLRSVQEPGVTVALGRNDKGDYHASYARSCWKLWLHASQRALFNDDRTRHDG